MPPCHDFHEDLPSPPTNRSPQLVSLIETKQPAPSFDKDRPASHGVAARSDQFQKVNRGSLRSAPVCSPSRYMTNSSKHRCWVSGRESYIHHEWMDAKYHTSTHNPLMAAGAGPKSNFQKFWCWVRHLHLIQPSIGQPRIPSGTLTVCDTNNCP